MAGWDRPRADPIENGAAPGNGANGADAPRRRGRRPGGTDTRAELLDAARVEFAQRGYEGATVRVIADRAGVDPAMVNHWFGGKEALFSEALQLPVNPAEVMTAILPGDPERLAERIVGQFLTVWDQTGGGADGHRAAQHRQPR